MRLKAKSYPLKKHLFLVSQLCFITTLHGAEVLRGVEASDDFLSIPPQQAWIESDGVELRSGTATEITFTRPNGQIDFNSPESPWDFSRHVAVAIDIENIGNGPVTLLGVLNHFGWNEGFLHLEAGEKGTMLLFLTRKREDETPWMDANFEKMRGMPGGQIMFRAGVDPAEIERILRHLGLWTEGVRLNPARAPPEGEGTVELFPGDSFPDYSMDPGMDYDLCANG